MAALATAAVACPLLLVACASGPKPAAPTTTGAGSAATTSVCSMVTPAEIRQQLGMSVQGPGASTSTATTICTYPSTDPAKDYESVIIGFRGHVTAAVAGLEQAQATAKYGQLTDASGTGVSAYYYSTTTGGHTVTTLVSLVNATQVTVATTASVAQAEALSQEIFTAFASAATSTTGVQAPATTAAP